LTNDLLFTLRPLEAMPDIELTGDFSHHLLVHEFPLPVPQVDLDKISKIITRPQRFMGASGTLVWRAAVCPLWADSGRSTFAGGQ
jgi:hypothetical protein